MLSDFYCMFFMLHIYHPFQSHSLTFVSLCLHLYFFGLDWNLSHLDQLKAEMLRPFPIILHLLIVPILTYVLIALSVLRFILLG